MYTDGTKFIGFQVIDEKVKPIYHNDLHGNITIESITNTFKDKKTKESITIHLNHRWVKI